MSGSKRPLRRLAYDGPMKYFALIGLAVSLGMAAPALAQYQPSNPAAQQQFEQLRGQMQQIRANERAQALNALTPQHRAMLSTMAVRLLINSRFVLTTDCLAQQGVVNLDGTNGFPRNEEELEDAEDGNDGAATPSKYVATSAEEYTDH